MLCAANDVITIDTFSKVMGLYGIPEDAFQFKVLGPRKVKCIKIVCTLD